MKTKIAEREYVCQGCGDVYDGSGAIVDNVDEIQTECDEYGTKRFICRLCASEGLTINGRTTVLHGVK